LLLSPIQRALAEMPVLVATGAFLDPVAAGRTLLVPVAAATASVLPSRLVAVLGIGIAEAMASVLDPAIPSLIVIIPPDLGYALGRPVVGAGSGAGHNGFGIAGGTKPIGGYGGTRPNGYARRPTGVGVG
jgi:hypothetical protein